MTIDNVRHGARMIHHKNQSSASTLDANDDADFQERTDLRRMLDTASCGLLEIDKHGLIRKVNVRAAELMGETQAYLCGKPISHFITPEDQALFFINRSRITADDETASPFDIRFKSRQGASWSARVHARPVIRPDEHLPGLMMAVEDVGEHQRALESLQIKTYATKLIFSINEDLSVWSTNDIDAVIDYTLEKIGVMVSADRVYVGLFHQRKTRFSITHEWLADGVESPDMQWIATPSLSTIMHPMRKRTAIRIDAIDALPPDQKIAHNEFHAPGSLAAMIAPLSYGRTILGLIGCDAVGRTSSWSAEDGQLLLHIGDAIIGALIRRQTETLPEAAREHLFQLIQPPTALGGEPIVEYDGPIEFVDEVPVIKADKKQWRLTEIEFDESDDVHTATLKDGQNAHLACNACYRQRIVKMDEIRSLGTRIKATCPCGQTMLVRIELRREFRKTVQLEGIFIRAPLNQMAPNNAEWGRMTVCNISRHGLGFIPLGLPDLQINDRFQVKFTLNNTAKSVIQKEVAVRSVASDTVGCEFTRKDPCDVTIGFYMMT